MAEKSTTQVIVIPAGEVCKDEAAFRDKEMVMKKQNLNSLFFSMSDTFKFLAGITLAAGMAVVTGALKNVNGFADALGKVAAEQTGLVFLGAAAACTAIAIGTNFVASRYYHSALFDQSEANAQHNAKYIVKEFKKEAAKTQEFTQNCRADGKSWVQVTRPQMAQATQQQPSIEA